jgi:hypothetical protein
MKCSRASTEPNPEKLSDLAMLNIKRKKIKPEKRAKYGKK